MTKLFVSPPAATGWSLDPQSLAQRLQADWPGADVDLVPPSSGRTVSLEYTCSVDGEVVHGSFDRPGQALVVEGSPRAGVRLIAWFRGIVTDEQDLLAYDESFEDSMPVLAGTTVQQLEAVFV